MQNVKNQYKTAHFIKIVPKNQVSCKKTAVRKYYIIKKY